MTQPIEMLEPQREPLSERAARRLRGALAENQISRTDLARALHMPQQKVSRKVLGQTPFTLDEIQLVADVLGLDINAVLGIGEHADRSIGRCSIVSPAGGGQWAPWGSNPQPAGYRTPLRAVA